MKRGNLFNPDIRNMGGRKLVVDQMYNHRMSLDNIQPKIGSLSGPAPTPKKNRNSISYQQFKEYQHLQIMRMKIANIKKSIDNDKPVSFDLIRKGQPCGASSKQYQFILEEHFKNLIAQKRQIDNFGTMNDRKKNAHDFIAYPPKFFRRLDSNSMQLYNSFIQQQRSHYQNMQTSHSHQFSSNRPKTAQVRYQHNEQMNQNGYIQDGQVNQNGYIDQNGVEFMNGNQNIFIQDPNGQYNQQLVQEYLQNIQDSIGTEQEQILLQQLQQNPELQQQLLYHQLQLQQENQQNEQEAGANDQNQFQQVKQNLQIQNPSAQKNFNNSITSAGNGLVSPSATTAGFSQQQKGSPVQSDLYLTSYSQSIQKNMNQADGVVNNSIKANNSKKSNNSPQVSQGVDYNTNKDTIQEEVSNYQNKSNPKSSPPSKIGSDSKNLKSPPSASSKKASQKSLTHEQQISAQELEKDQEEQKWLTLIEEIPVLLDANEESLKALKMHLINLILEFRLYRLVDYNSMKEIFIQKNKDISQELVDEIFNEIIDALNE